MNRFEDLQRWAAIIAAMTCTCLNAEQAVPVPTDIPELKPLEVDDTIRLEHLFPSPVYGDEPALTTSQHSTMRLAQLVGVLKQGGIELAWIRIGPDSIFQLSRGQAVPGSTFKVDRIRIDSVELINTLECESDNKCESRIILDMYH